jgi:ligand-binding sensor domain-containing protein/DNA-binding CsgD family transcriptional regulator
MSVHNKIKILTSFALFLLVFLTQAALSEEIKSIGVPYIQNYSKSSYLSGNQNWSITKDNRGLMYFGNAQGLLTFDGRYWQQYEMPNRQIVRSVAADDSGKIYTGGFGEFGFWSSKNKRLRYTSLSKNIAGGIHVTDEIWKIYVDGQRVLFQSFSTIYIYEHNKVQVIKTPGGLLFLHQVGKRFFVEVLDKGLYELFGSELRPLKNLGSKLPPNVLSILPLSNGNLLIGTKKNSLFVYDGQRYTPFQTEAAVFLQTYQLNNGVKLMSKYFAYGTILNGIIIIDEQGRIVQRINKASGLQNNTVLSLFIDKEQNLWTGLDNGIDRIELNSPLYYYFDKVGQLGTVYSSLIYKGNIYLGTNQGLFYSNWKPASGGALSFKLIPNSQGQVWDLTEVDGQLLCGHNDGTFRITGGSMEQISTISGGWTIKKLNSNPAYLIQGTYNGLVLYKKDPRGLWTYFRKIANFGAPSRYVEQDAHGDIWVSHAYKGIYKLTLSPDLRTVISSTYYDQKNGLPASYNVNIFSFENKLVFSSDSAFYNYDELTNRFSNYTALNKELGSFATSNRIISAGNKKYWFINHGKMGLADFSIPGKSKIESNRFQVLDGRMVQYYENISKISNQIYLISVDDGFVVYDASAELGEAGLSKIPKVLVRNIYDITDTFKLWTETGEETADLEIPYSRNNIRISYSLPFYRQASIRYQYLLKGFSKHWSDWSASSQKDFTNLSWGTYTFQVRASVNGKKDTQVTEFHFTILPPFYATKWAVIFYVLLAALILYMLKQLYERKLLKDKLQITAKLQLEKEIHLKKEAEANEKQIIQLEHEKLQAELAGKSRELANSAMSLVYKNELLQKLSQEIAKLKDDSGLRIPEEQQRKIQNVITEGMNDNRDWNLFEHSFNEAHDSFFKKLKAQHPDLVPNDLKLCAFLYMNMSSKEMASLLNISLRGVEIRRYRLRKKLNVPHDKNLVEFLMGI